MMLYHTLIKGESFGEMGIVNNSVRNATIMAMRDTHLLVMNKE